MKFNRRFNVPSMLLSIVFFIIALPLYFINIYAVYIKISKNGISLDNIFDLVMLILYIVMICTIVHVLLSSIFNIKITDEKVLLGYFQKFKYIKQEFDHIDVLKISSKTGLKKILDVSRTTTITISIRKSDDIEFKVNNYLQFKKDTLKEFNKKLKEVKKRK